MHPWEDRYGAKPLLGIYTPAPELITDSLDRWNIKFLGNYTSTIQLYPPPKSLEKYISRVHDRGWDLDYPHCLYVPDPLVLDVSNLYTCMDLDHTMYYDYLERFAVYRRDQTHLIKIINIDSRPKTGVIFIDCWQKFLDQKWQYHDDYRPTDNFYQRMIKNLWQYNLHNFVFLDTDFDPHPLANCLVPWAKHKHSVLLSTIQEFQLHIESTKIKHWIVVGAHWKFCTHDQALGFFNLLKIKQQSPDLHFYSLPDSTAKFIINNGDNSVLTVCSEQDYVQDCLHWNLQNDLVELELQ